MKKVWVSAGGTGGHVVPCVSIATSLLNAGFDVCWVGACNRGEFSHFNDSCWPSYGYKMKGLRGGSLFGRVGFVFYFLLATLKVCYLLLRLRPDAVVATGGYGSLPVVFSCYIFGFKYYLCEQNIVAGYSNRLFAQGAAGVFCGYGQTQGFSSEVKLYPTGNPIHPVHMRYLLEQPSIEPDMALLDLSKKEKIYVLVVGGSQGASCINAYVPLGLGQIDKKFRSKIHVIHICGKKQAVKNEVEKLYQSLAIDHEVIEFSSSMNVYRHVDVVISRSGAMSMSEVTAYRLPCLYIPYAHAVDDHQMKNAQHHVDCDLGLLCTEQMLCEDIGFFVSRFEMLLNGYLQYKTKLMCYDRVMMLNASQQIVAIVAKGLRQNKTAACDQK